MKMQASIQQWLDAILAQRTTQGKIDKLEECIEVMKPTLEAEIEELKQVNTDLQNQVNELTNKAGVDNSEKITRVEVITNKGREFGKRLFHGHFTVSMQDDNRTMKLFEDAE
jgi:hypothetical protein